MGVTLPRAAPTCGNAHGPEHLGDIRCRHAPIASCGAILAGTPNSVDATSPSGPTMEREWGAFSLTKSAARAGWVRCSPPSTYPEPRDIFILVPYRFDDDGAFVAQIPYARGLFVPLTGKERVLLVRCR
ncbi:hypothetical protein AB0B25_30760 [Nocardia sp. NPDC049190]|uniref:hypothetical protein n=1 Tax=Nocardia sp. NPDC049190 TaxID=3155650 RepID=UPI0033CB96C6